MKGQFFSLKKTYLNYMGNLIHKFMQAKIKFNTDIIVLHPNGSSRNAFAAILTCLISSVGTCVITASFAKIYF